jgi:hypothetical protein
VVVFAGSPPSVHGPLKAYFRTSQCVELPLIFIYVCPSG